MKTDSANFDLERGCAGVNLGNFHRGYFSDPQKARIFSDVLLESLAQAEKTKKLQILGLGSGPALPEIILYRSLTAAGYKVKMTISDKIKEAMKSHYPGYEIKPGDAIKKMEFDSQEIPFEDESFDAVLTRDTLHYQTSKTEMEGILKEVKRILKPGGIFLNQETDFPNLAEANLANFERQLVGKYIQHIPGKDMRKMHESVFGESNTSHLQISSIYNDEQELIQRFRIDNQEKSTKIINLVISEIRSILKEGNSENIQLPGNNQYVRMAPVQLISAQKA